MGPCQYGSGGLPIKVEEFQQDSLNKTPRKYFFYSNA